MIRAGSRSTEEVVHAEVGEEMHDCIYCGTRTILDDAGYYAHGGRNHGCPHCGQRYKLTDEDEMVSLDGEGEIEILDERTGEVIGTTAEPTVLDGVLADLAPTGLPEASQADLDHLFGVKPSPYGADFGSFG